MLVRPAHDHRAFGQRLDDVFDARDLVGAQRTAATADLEWTGHAAWINLVSEPGAGAKSLPEIRSKNEKVTAVTAGTVRARGSYQRVHVGVSVPCER